MKAASISKQLRLWKRRFIEKSALYFADQPMRFVRDSDNSVQLQSVDKVPSNIVLLVVARRHYSEVVRSYPVEQSSEVRKLVKMEFEGQRYHFSIARKDKGKTLVNIWIFSSELPAALMTIPESLVLTLSVSENEVVSYEFSHTSFAVRSQQITYSQEANNLVRDAQAFLMAVGLKSGLSNTVITQRIFAGRLIEGLIHLSVRRGAGFIALPKQNSESNNRTLKYLAVPALTVFVAYMVGVSVYLLGSEWYYQRQLESTGSELSSALALQDKLAAQESDYLQLSEFLQQQEPVYGLWFVMADMFEAANFSRISYDRGRVVLAGEAEKATDVMERLSANPWARAVRFDSPTRSSRNKDRFVISFALQVPETGGDHGKQ